MKSSDLKKQYQLFSVGSIEPTGSFLFFYYRLLMNLVFNTFELIAIVLSILIANLVVEDGESNWLECVQFLMAYAIMAVAFFFHP